MNSDLMAQLLADLGAYRDPELSESAKNVLARKIADEALELFDVRSA